MASCPNSSNWRPRWVFQGDPYAAIVFTTASAPKTCAWASHGRHVCLLAADFLEKRLYEGSVSDLESDASFLYVLLAREPREFDEPLEIEADSALAEFGFGQAPAAPDEWESVRLRDLIAAAIDWLRGVPSG